MSKIIIKEAESTTVNDEQLMGLYDAAAKTEGQIINLAVAAMKFSNMEIKRAVNALKSQANQLVVLIAGAIEASNGSSLNADPTTVEPEGPQPIEQAPGADKMIENTQSNGSAMNIMEAKAKAVHFFVHKGFNLNEAIALAEKFDPSIFNKNKEVDKEEDKEEKPVEECNDTMKEADEIVLTECMNIVKDGISVNNMNNFKKSLTEALSIKSFGENYETIVEAIFKATNAETLNEAFNALYDFADENNITIIA